MRVGIKNLRIEGVSMIPAVGRSGKVILKTEVLVSYFRHRRCLRVVHEVSNPGRDERNTRRTSGSRSLHISIALWMSPRSTASRI